MKKIALVPCGLLLVVWFMILSAHSQDDVKFVPSDVFHHPQRPPAVFRHEEHNEVAGIEDCNECHHVYDDNGKRVEDESSEDQRCSDCHDLKNEGRKPGLMQAFHTNCKGCHEKEKKGPVMCGQCHVRNPVIEG